VALEVPAVVTAKSSRRPIGERTAAEMQRAPVSERMGAMQPSTPREAERVAHPANADRKPAILTIGGRRPQGRRLIRSMRQSSPEEPPSWQTGQGAGAGVMAERLATKEAIVRCMSKPIIYQKRQFPTHAALAEHLAPRLGRSVKAVRSALNRYNGDVKRVIAHGDNAIPIIHQGQHFPSRTALAKHLAPLLGKSVAALKATLHRCNGDVRRVVDLASRPISARKRNRVIVERLAAGATLQTIADEFGLTRQRVSRINIDLTGERLQIQPDPWPAKRTARLRAMLDQGLRPAQIAPRLGVSRNAVYGKIHRLRRRQDARRRAPRV
jgi:DNA-binding CsgD family transcriptional regulator